MNLNKNKFQSLCRRQVDMLLNQGQRRTVSPIGFIDTALSFWCSLHVQQMQIGKKEKRPQKQEVKEDRMLK